MEKIALILVMILLFAIGVIGISSYRADENHQKEFTGWAKACERAGGITSMTRYNWFDCIVDGKVIVLPGYEKYEAEKPL